MAGTLQLLQCVIPVDEAEDDPRIASDYAASSAALLELFSTEVLAVKRWPSWGIPEAHFPAFPAFLAVYGVWREATLVDGAFDRAVKEIICACVSLSSSCNFCANGHAVCARLGGMEGALKLVRDRSAGHIKDERVRTLATWALAVREPYSQSVRQPPPMSPRDAVELLGSVLHAIYKNVFASIFVGAGPLPDAFPQPVRAASMYSSAAMASMNRVMQIFLMPRSKRASPRRIREVWARLPTPFDPSSVVLPPDLWWSTPNAAIADALRFMVVEQERIEARWLPPSVAAAVTRFIAYEYRGRPMAYIDGEWATAAGMPTVEGNDNVFLVSFLLTAALDSSAVRGELIDEFRRRFEHLDEVVELMLREVISWAAWVASRRMVAWMGAYASPGGQQYA